jgi:hypothetical protein
MATLREFQVTFDCAEPEEVGRFWCDVLGYVVPPSYDETDETDETDDPGHTGSDA